MRRCLAQDHPDAAALSTLLAKVVPADKVGESIQILGHASASAEDKAFLLRYFAPFLPPGADLPCPTGTSPSSSR